MSNMDLMNEMSNQKKKLENLLLKMSDFQDQNGNLNYSRFRGRLTADNIKDIESLLTKNFYTAQKDFTSSCNFWVPSSVIVMLISFIMTIVSYFHDWDVFLKIFMGLFFLCGWVIWRSCRSFMTIILGNKKNSAEFILYIKREIEELEKSSLSLKL